MDNQLYFEVTGECRCSVKRRIVIFPADNADNSVRLFAKEYPTTTRILSVREVTKTYFDMQEQNKAEEKRHQDSQQRWNQILKESR